MFIDNLELLMKQKGINKHELASESGVPYTTIVSFWKVGYENVRLSTLRKLANYFDVTLDYLVNGNVVVLTPREISVIEAYRKHRELHGAIDRMLNVTPAQLSDIVESSDKK